MTNEVNVLMEDSVINTSTRVSLFDYVNSGTSLPKLKEGEHTATLLNWKIVEPVKVTDKPYVRLDLKLSDRQIVDNRFEVGFYIFESQIKSQLLIETPILVKELLNNLKTINFKIWISYVTVTDTEGNTKVHRNVNYAPSAPAVKLAVVPNSSEKAVRY